MYKQKNFNNLIKMKKKKLIKYNFFIKIMLIFIYFTRIK